MWPHQPMVEFGALVVFGVAMVAIVIAFATLVKALVWVALLPIRMILWLVGTMLVVPLLAVKAIFGGLLMLVVVPAVVIAALAAGVAMVAVGTALLVPLIPLGLVLALIWYLVKPEPQALVRS